MGRHVSATKDTKVYEGIQWRTKHDGEWQDVPAEGFENIGPSFRRIVYVSPGARVVPLTDAEIVRIWLNTPDAEGASGYQDIVAFARAILATQEPK